MTDLSSRQLDAFDNPAKAACREGNLRVLRDAAYLLWENGDRTRLRCDWCELMGATDPKKAGKGTIRADFASSIDANAVHGSDAPETARTEIAFFFPGYEIFPR